MSIYPWIEKIDFQKFAMPLVVKRDNEYYPGIVEKLDDLVFELERCGASDKIVLAVKEYRKKIISSIILYYQGDLVDAQLIVNEMLDEFNDAAPAITDINSSIAFPGGGPDYSEVQFFRARLSENVVEFSSEDMLHIPFNKRHIVKSERFSIPGLFAKYNGEESLSEICQHLEVGTSFNFALFKQLLPCQLYKTYELRALSTPYINNVGTKNHFFPYTETQFFEFDKYLFANWHRDWTIPTL